tara:strand:+ start:432 stop:1418 length:987 start_codon:yes stop_codon:yes gene_type:complete
MGKIGINMSGLLKKLSFRTGQSRKIVYYRPIIFGKDEYGVENNSIIVNEINVPSVPAYIRNIVDKDYVIERGGHNITGKSRIFLPNLATIKNYPNLDQDTNTYFNDITGFDQLIDYDRTVYTPTVSSNTGWAAGTMDSTFAGQGYGGTTLTITMGSTVSGTFSYTNSGANILESDRLTFKLKASGALYFKGVNVYGSGTTDAWKYGINASSTSSNVLVPTGDWITVDVPYTSGTSLSSVYLSGSRYGFNVTQGASWKNGTYNLNNLEFDVSGANSELKIKELKFYKSSVWHVQKVNDYNDEYMAFDCVRTSGKRDKIRRAYGIEYNTP